MVEIKVVPGDITQVEADALITPINSGGMWFGGIDQAIQRVAGNHYHSQAALALGELKNLATVGAAGHRRLHQGKFNNVIFVVDDLVSPLREVIVAGLKTVYSAGFKTVTLPTMRLGVMRGVVEKTTEEAINEMVEGVKTFLGEHPNTQLETITFVVYNDPDVETQLKATLTAS